MGYGKFLKRLNFYISVNIWYEIKQNLKWSLGVFIAILVSILLLVRPETYLDIDYYVSTPPILILNQLIIPFIICIFVGTLLRFLWHLWKNS